jgi:hypothetical protein
MPAFTTFLAIGGLAMSVASAQQQKSAANEARDAQERSAAESRKQAVLEQKRADVQNARQLRNAVRQARIARGVVINSGANSGTSKSSGVMGGVSSIDSQESANTGFASTIGEINSGVQASQVEQANASVAYGKAQGDSAEWGAFGKLGSTVFDAAGGFKTIFDSVEHE